MGKNTQQGKRGEGDEGRRLKRIMIAHDKLTPSFSSLPSFASYLQRMFIALEENAKQPQCNLTNGIKLKGKEP